MPNRLSRSKHRLSSSGKNVLLWLLSCIAAVAVMHAQSSAETAGNKITSSTAEEKFENSPWLIAPIFQSSPKLGTSAGALAGYLHYFDEKSRPSIFALQGQYSSTNSIIGGAFGKASFDEDRQRLVGGLLYGYVKNDYDDYLGTGVPLKSNVDLRAFFTRYQYRFHGNWFGGVQGVYQNVAIGGETAADDVVIDALGLRPYKTGGLGLVVTYDSRDDENMPTRGWMVNLNNIAYREAFGGEEDFDTIRLESRYYLPHGDGNVLAFRQMNQFTRDAPTQARANVQLRGYKVGQYNGVYMSSIEVEERWRLAKKWTATLFVGVAGVYGDGQVITDSANIYPAGGGGVQYVLKPKQGIVLNLEYAQGEAGNSGVYLKMGYAY